MPTPKAPSRYRPGSYAAKRRRRPFNWPRFLSRKTHTFEQLEAASKLSGTWVTCACGNLCAELPRRGKEHWLAEGAPTDGPLYDLGVAFHRHITNAKYYAKSGDPIAEHIRRARTTLAQIERRSAELLKQIAREAALT